MLDLYLQFPERNNLQAEQLLSEETNAKIESILTTNNSGMFLWL
jgi:hypothetical protein